jgi:multisubunit Na+/H+ antiporter MnhG subunit
MAEHEIHEDHGHSVAAWTGVGVILVGAAVASWGVAIASTIVFVIGVVICVLGAVAGKVLSMAGYGGGKTLDGPDAPESGRGELGVR